ATEAFGERAVFLLDSATYLVSAFYVTRTRIPQDTDDPGSGSILRIGATKIVEGWSYLRRVPAVGRLTLAKAGWSLGGGGLVYLLALLGDEVAPHAAAAAMGFLYSARGIGTGLGPVLARRFLPDSGTWSVAMGWCILTSGLFYAAVAWYPWTYWVALPVLAAHTASGANWVMTTVLLQRRSEDRYRGRVFATEWLLIMAADALSILTASLLLEHEILDLAGAFVLFGAIQVSCGLAWLLVVVPRERAEAP
ncbi:MAG: MFS transporter, partial [Thermoanaerobaculia bacterium]|nr:MFS transporter [Thermoanaerobaculia bacterium]